MTDAPDDSPAIPGHIRRVEVDGYSVATYTNGDGPETLLLVNGGPGLPCDYLRDSHVPRLAGDLYRVVAWDQLGTGASDRPDDPALWTIARYAREVETVRQALGLGRVHLLGQSWGAFLAIEYAVTYPEAVATLVIEGGAADLASFRAGTESLRVAHGLETHAMMLRHEAAGTLDDPAYAAAMDILFRRHFCRLPDLPPPLQRSIAGNNQAVFQTMMGPNDFHVTGNLRDWNRLDDLAQIAAPALVLAGRHDVVTPAVAATMHARLPDSQLVIFEDSSHSPFFEEPDAYFTTLRAFLDAHPIA